MSKESILSMHKNNTPEQLTPDAQRAWMSAWEIAADLAFKRGMAASMDNRTCATCAHYDEDKRCIANSLYVWQSEDHSCYEHSALQGIVSYKQ